MELRRVTRSAVFVLCSALSFQASGTKFIPTFAVYYGGGPTLVAADAARLAKFDLISIDRFRYYELSPNTWAAIKAINPQVQIYLYEMGSEAPNYLDGTPQLYLNGLGRYNVARGHPMGSLNGDRRELFLLDASGNRIHNVQYSNPALNQYWHLMDFGAATYQSYWLAAVKADVVDQPWVADGIFADNCGSPARYSGTFAKYPSNAKRWAAMNSFAGAIAAGLHRYGQKLWCNRGDTRMPEGSAAWRALDASANPPDAVLEEGAFAVGWGAPVQFYPETEWKRQVDTMGAIKNSKVTMLSHTRLAEGETGTDNWGKPVTYWQTLWYSLASFLLGKNDALGNAYFMFNGPGEYSRIWWHDAYDKIDLGKAVGPYSVATIGGVNVYSREFEKGYVYVNPTATAVLSVTLPQASVPLTHDNLRPPLSSTASVKTIALKGHTAALLRKSEAATH